VLPEALYQTAQHNYADFTIPSTTEQYVTTSCKYTCTALRQVSKWYADAKTKVVYILKQWKRTSALHFFYSVRQASNTGLYYQLHVINVYEVIAAVCQAVMLYVMHFNLKVRKRMRPKCQSSCCFFIIFFYLSYSLHIAIRITGSNLFNLFWYLRHVVSG
jgi:hypothetical protein